ncbi:MAG: UvrD-helicase domain-containing protein, partial [Phycisphaerales bacterium]
MVDGAGDEAWRWELPPRPLDVIDRRAIESARDLAERATVDVALGGRRVRNAIEVTIGALEEVIRSREYASNDRVPLGVWSDLVQKGMLRALVSGGGLFYGREVHPEICEAMRPIADVALWEIERIALRRTSALGELLRLYRECRTDVLSEMRRVSFDSVARGIGRHLRTHPFSELLRRLDARIDHLLLDEFQDTSRVQWDALRPLASEIVATSDGSRVFFAVGDLKQSIYGWRGGDPEIFENLTDRFDGGRGAAELVDTPLDLVRRSTAEVLEAVNLVFGGVATNEVVNRASSRAAMWWARVFRPHESHRSLDGRSGQVASTAEEGMSASDGGQSGVASLGIAELHLVARRGDVDVVESDVGGASEEVQSVKQ